MQSELSPRLTCPTNAYFQQQNQIVQMVNVGWIGTGKLGLPMAARIAASGTRVRAYVRSRERVETIQAAVW